MKLSVVLSVYNEEKNLKKVLSSVSFADEIVVVDNQSTDNSVKIAEVFKAKIYSQPNRILLEVNKNFGFEKAKGDWILSLDADEEVTADLKEEILQAVNSKNHAGFLIPRKNIIFGKWIRHSLWWPDYQLRLFKKGSGKFLGQKIHEHLEIKGLTGFLKNPIVHYNYNSVSQFLYKLDKIYTESEAESFLKSGKKLVWTDALKMPVEDFLKTFFSQKGYLDGIHGLVLSLLQAFYQEVVFAKVWEKQNFQIDQPTNLLTPFLNEIKKIAKDFRYWENSTLKDEAKSPFLKFFYRVKRKFRI